MNYDPSVLQKVPLFSLLDEEERGMLARKVLVRNFDPNQRIYRKGDAGGKGYVLVDGMVNVTLIDQDHQEITIDQPEAGGFFGFASLLDGTPHQTSATAMTAVRCLEVDREDLSDLIRQKPDAGMDMLVMVGRHFHASQKLVQMRSLRSANDMIEEQSTLGERISDRVARFGGSWKFILSFGAVLVVYVAANVGLNSMAWDPYPFILLNLFLSMLAAIQAPVIMMSQNRQDGKDRMRGEMDFDVNRRSELEIRGLSQKLHQVSNRLGDIEDLLRKRG